MRAVRTAAGLCALALLHPLVSSPRRKPHGIAWPRDATGGFGACAFNSTQIGDSVSTKTAVAFHARAILMLVATAATTACASAAPEYGGRWKSVNRYADIPQEIPLVQAYAFYPSPMDGTLKTMLERWARDSKMTLSYQHPSDFTLHSAVADIRTNNLQEAVSQLTTAFAQQGVSITTEGNQIVVRGSTPAATASPTDTASTAAP